MNGLPYVAFYFGDFVAGVRVFTTEEVGAYILLLGYQWINGPLPDNAEDLARIAGVTVTQRVRNKFETTPAGLLNARLERERIRGLAKKAKNLAKVQKHRAKRKDVPGNVTVTSGLQSGFCSDYDSHSSKMNGILPLKPKKPTKREDFETAWKAYPDKSGSKEKAFAAFQRSGDELQTVLDGIERYKASVAAKRANGFPTLNYKNGQTFFNGMDWRSECALEEPPNPVYAAPEKPRGTWDIEKQIETLRSERDRLNRSDFENESGRQAHPEQFAKVQKLNEKIRDLRNQIAGKA